MNRLHPSRRTVLKGMGALGAVGTGVLSASRAGAFTGGGYKALVCVFLKGGLDGHDTLIPYDRASYDQWAATRASLLQAYTENPGGSTRLRNQLTEIAPRVLAGQDFGTRAFALPPEMDAIATLFADQKASIVANVGPLARPTTTSQIANGTATLPPKLFSHNDQQATWASLAPSGAGTGWGAAFAEAANAARANTDPAFAMVSVAGADDFLQGRLGRAFEVDASGVQLLRELDSRGALGHARNSAAAQDALEGFFRGAGRATTNLFERDVIATTKRALDANKTFADEVEDGTSVAAAFPDSALGAQLEMVARTIANRSGLGATRQVFLVAAGGFDTHSEQAPALPALQRQVAEAIAAFHAATVEMGVESDVTTFTASDFGRTLVANGDGTDHGWGGHQVVVGGGIDGGRLFGDAPPPTLGHAQDAGRGRLIPTVSVEQVAQPLGRWFGLSEAQAASVFPGLAQQDAPVPLFG